MAAMDDVPVPPLAVHDWRFAVDTLMEEQGLSQSELAEKMGVTKARVSQIMRADNMTVRSMAAVARALGYQMRVEFSLLTELE